MRNTTQRSQIPFTDHTLNGSVPRKSRYRHILVPTGLTKSDRPALQLGLEMAHTHGAKLTFLHVLSNVAFDTSTHWLDALDRLHHSLSRQRRTVAKNDRKEALKLTRLQMQSFLNRELPGFSERVPADTLECCIGEVTNEIVRAASGVDLVIMSSPPLRWWSALLPSRAQQVLLLTKKEMLLLHPSERFVTKAKAAIA